MSYSTCLFFILLYLIGLICSDESDSDGLASSVKLSSNEDEGPNIKDIERDVEEQVEVTPCVAGAAGVSGESGRGARRRREPLGEQLEAGGAAAAGGPQTSARDL